MASAAERFESKVDRSGEHHLWTGSATSRGVGQIRVQGKLRTASQVAWELAHGEIPDGAVVQSCPDAPLCVHPDHLTLKSDQAPTSKRSSPGGGTIRELGNDKWKLTVSVGRDENDKHRRVSRTVRGTRAEASRALAAFSVEVQTGQKRPAPPGAPLTLNELVEWYLVFATEERGLEHSTIVGYGEVYDMWLRDQIGHTRAERLSPADLDRAFGRMRRKGLSRMINARAAIAGAYKWGRRHGKVSNNPTVGFELPTSMHIAKKTATPELDELLAILADANENDHELAPVLTLAATTGMRRGELSGLRRSRLNLDRAELVVDQAVNDAGGTVVVKPTKTRQTRTVGLDAATVSFLREHIETMDKRAAELRLQPRARLREADAPGVHDPPHARPAQTHGPRSR